MPPHRRPQHWLFFISMACAGLSSAQAQSALDEAEAPREPPTPAARSPRLEGAYGLNLGWHPEYNGGARRVLKATPGLFLRWGRYTLTNASGFATRQQDDVVPGLGVDMVRSDKVRLGFSLRADAGRSASSSPAFAGLGNIRPTVRLRAAGSWTLSGPWRLGAAWSVDTLGRGGGDYLELNGGWEERLMPDTLFRVGSSLTLAGRRYMQSYFGISAEQSARSAYPVYSPQAGLRDVSVYASARHDIGRVWILIAGVSATRLLGPAAASPLTLRPASWSLGVGVARSF